MGFWHFWNFHRLLFLAASVHPIYRIPYPAGMLGLGYQNVLSAQ